MLLVTVGVYLVFYIIFYVICGSFILICGDLRCSAVICGIQADRHHVLTTLTIWLTGRWSSVRVKLTLTDGQGFLQRAHT